MSMSNDKEMGKAFSEGIKIALVGGDWSKGIQDHAEQYGPFPSDSRLRHFVRHGQPPAMSNAEAIKILENIETDIYGRIAIAKAIDALSSPWAKTSDRLPNSRDENGFEVIVAYNPELGNEHGYGYAACIKAWCVDPQSWPYWMPIPPLPEVEK